MYVREGINYHAKEETTLPELIISCKIDTMPNIAPREWTKMQELTESACITL